MCCVYVLKIKVFFLLILCYTLPVGYHLSLFFFLDTHIHRFLSFYVTINYISYPAFSIHGCIDRVHAWIELLLESLNQSASC